MLAQCPEKILRDSGILTELCGDLKKSVLMFVDNLIYRNVSVVAVWNNIGVDNVCQALLSVYFKNEGVSLR